jgi:hypothetical protein
MPQPPLQRDALGEPLEHGDSIVVVRTYGSSIRMVPGIVSHFGPGPRVYFQFQHHGRAGESWTSPERVILKHKGATSE